MSAKSRMVYVVVGYDHKSHSSYISSILSSRKKAEEYKNYIEILMKDHEDTLRSYWIQDRKVG